ncbi:hypothetical protein ACOSQ4_032269 [Xanthoceras sorbifolium]
MHVLFYWKICQVYMFVYSFIKSNYIKSCWHFNFHKKCLCLQVLGFDSQKFCSVSLSVFKFMHVWFVASIIKEVDENLMHILIAVEAGSNLEIDLPALSVLKK